MNVVEQQREDAALGAAWRRAEAALPEGACDLLVYHFDPTAGHTDSYGAKTVDAAGHETYGYGATPAAALEALVTSLAVAS